MRKSLFFKKGLICIATVIAMQSAQGQWVKKADNLQFQQGRWGGMSAVINNKILITGGYANAQWLNDLQEYDPAIGTWKMLANPTGPVNRSEGVAFAINGKLYVGLGAEYYLAIPPAGPHRNLKDLWEYNPATNAWTQKASLPDSSRTESNVFVVNNKAYIVGGNGVFDGGTTVSQTNQVWEYDPAGNKWTKKANYPETAGVRSAAAFAINGKGYISCGSSGSSVIAKTYEYNPTSNAWTPKADFPDSARDGVVSFVVDNKGFVGLGASGGFNNYKSTFYYYNPATDKWSYLHGSWPVQARKYALSEVVGNKAYVGCGWRVDGTAQTYFRDWYEMDVVAKLGIENTSVTNKLNVYPNPSTGVVHVNVENGTYNYALYSITGQKAATGLLGADKTINLSDLPQGQYILELVSEEQTYRSIVSLNK